MTVDTRLKGYFANVTLFHETGEQVWLDLLDITAMSDHGPAGKAAQKFLKGKKERYVDSG